MYILHKSIKPSYMISGASTALINMVKLDKQGCHREEERRGDLPFGFGKPETRFHPKDFDLQLFDNAKNVTINKMRPFDFAGKFLPNIFNIIKERYQISDDHVRISHETVNKIINDHPEFGGMDIKSFVHDILRNASVVQTNQRNDTVRIVCMNRDLENAILKMSEDKYFYLILRLSNDHPVNFVKSLYPRNKIKGGEVLWSKPRV